MKKEGSSQPRVLMIGPLAPPMGGMQTSINNLARSSLLAGMFDLDFLDTTGLRTRGKGNLLQGVFYQISLLFRLAHILIKRRPDIAHFHMKMGFYFYRRLPEILLARLSGSRVILQIRGSDITYFYEKGSFLTRYLLKSILSAADRVLALSDAWKDLILSIAPRSDVVVVPNGVFISDFKMDENIRRKAGIRPDAVMALFLGGISYKKGAFDLLRLVSENKELLRDIYFVVAGGVDNSETEVSPHEKEKIFKNTITNLGLQDNLIYAGPLEGQTKIDYMMSADIFFSATHAENFPNVMLEAMAAGLPIVITDVGSVRGVIEDGVGGFIVKVGDVRAMGEKLVLLARDESLRKKMGAANLRLARDKYDMSIVADKIAVVYRSVLER